MYPAGNKNVDWSNYAYSLYATDSATLCHAVLIFNALEKLGSKADRVLFYPHYWDLVVHNKLDRDSQLLVEAKKRYKVKLQPIDLLSVEGRTPGMCVCVCFGLVAQKSPLFTTTKGIAG